MKVIIAARMSSSRLPGKALLPIYEQLSMLDVLAHRINQAKFISGIILATSDNKSDDPLVSWAVKNNVQIFRGSLDDVLGRLSGCIKYFELDNFVEILGDNPLVDPNDIDLCIKSFNTKLYDYVATSTTEYDYAINEMSYPVGVRVQCMKSDLIHNAARDLLDPHSREHSSSFIYHSDNIYKTKLINYPHPVIKDAFKLNLAVNTSSDFTRTAEVLKACGLNASLNEILTYLN
tara:strand:+ start:288 stop:986 length:699 start_codon:yes stop_codon:yes gene_type:complete